MCDSIRLSVVTIFFFKQKTAYELRISDWSSDVCSSDLHAPAIVDRRAGTGRRRPQGGPRVGGDRTYRRHHRRSRAGAGSSVSIEPRSDWTRDEIAALFELPFTELVFRAADVHRATHAAGEVQLCTLLSIKTGGCAEDCGFLSPSASARRGVKATNLMT